MNTNEEQHGLAYEMLKEVKASARRWFIIALVELCIIIGIVGVFIWYISLPTEEVTSYEQSIDDINDSDVRQIIGEEQ